MAAARELFAEGTGKRGRDGGVQDDAGTRGQGRQGGVEHRPRLFGRGYGEQQELGAGRRVRRVRGGLPTGRDEPRHGLGREVEAAHAKASADEAGGHRPAHRTEADEADPPSVHRSLPRRWLPGHPCARSGRRQGERETRAPCYRAGNSGGCRRIRGGRA